jgi:hypothetical protein
MLRAKKNDHHLPLRIILWHRGAQNGYEYRHGQFRDGYNDTLYSSYMTNKDFGFSFWLCSPKAIEGMQRPLLGTSSLKRR